MKTLTAYDVCERINKYWAERGIVARAGVVNAGQLSIVTSVLTGREHDPTADASFLRANAVALKVRPKRREDAGGRPAIVTEKEKPPTLESKPEGTLNTDENNVL
jgi:hypothetical protein